MRVIATRDFKFFYSMVPHPVSKGDVFNGDVALHLLRTKGPVEPDDDEARAALQPDRPAEPEAVSGGSLDLEGTIPAVLEWVGDDKEKAAQAREAESARDKPRSTLIARLDEILGS